MMIYYTDYSTIYSCREVCNINVLKLVPKDWNEVQ